MAMASLESAPIYLPVVQETAGGFFFTPQWLQWFLNTRSQINVTSNTTTVHVYNTQDPGVSLTNTFQVGASVSFTASSVTPPVYLNLIGTAQVTGAGVAADLQDVEFALYEGTSQLQALQTTVSGLKKAVCTVNFLVNANFTSGSSYTFTMRGRSVGVPAFTITFDRATLSAVGASS